MEVNNSHTNWVSEIKWKVATGLVEVLENE